MQRRGFWYSDYQLTLVGSLEDIGAGVTKIPFLTRPEPKAYVSLARKVRLANYGPSYGPQPVS